MKNKLIFGSAAMKYWWPDYDKSPRDVDYLCDSPVLEKTPGVEYHYALGLGVVFSRNVDDLYVDPDILYTIKVSHLPWEGKNGKWWKHLKDAVFMKNKGCVVVEDVYALLYKEWQKRFGDKSHISLDKATEMFFDDALDRVIDHDKAHELFSIREKPAYTRILPSEDSPMCSKELFLSLSEDDKIYTVLEEMFVVSFERNITLANSYMQLATRMTKGWWNRFLIENAETILDGYEQEKQSYKLKRSKIWNYNKQ